MNFNQLVDLYLTEAKHAKKDYDKDGKIESPEDEYKGSKDKAIKQAMHGKKPHHKLKKKKK